MNNNNINQMKNKTIQEKLDWLNSAKEKGICPFCGIEDIGFHIQKYHRDELVALREIRK